MFSDSRNDPVEDKHRGRVRHSSKKAYQASFWRRADEWVVKNWKKVSVVLIIIINLLGGIVYTIKSQNIRPSEECYYQTFTKYSTTTTSIISYQQTQSHILRERMVVPPGYYIYHPFKAIREISLKGYFTSEDRDGEIVLIILDDLGFANFINRKAFASYYDSGRVARGELNIILPAGEYYLVISNLFSESRKIVNLEVIAEWLEPTTQTLEYLGTYSQVTYICG
ncbi:MAG: hypothetical protein QXP57_07105 [Nitrososphaerota archaeon]